MREQPITVFADGHQSRCFCWVGDAVAALVRLCDHPDAVGQVFNIDNDEEVTTVTWRSEARPPQSAV